MARLHKHQVDMGMPEKRKNERFWVEQAVTVLWDGREFTGTTTNMSLGGASIVVELDPMPRIGDRIHVVYRVPSVSDPIDVPAYVRWRTGGNRFGIQFATGFRARQTYELNQYFRRSMAEDLSA